MTIIETLIKEAREEFAVKYEPEWIAGNIPTKYFIRWLSQAFERVKEEERKYIGKQKREWYMKGFREGQHPQEKKK